MPQIPTRKAYKIRSPQTWDLIRSRYTRGETAKSLAEAFDVTEDAIRNRARKEGWTKRAYAAASEQNLSADRAAAAPLKAARPCAPAPDEARAVPDEPADGEQVAALALGAAARCIAAGRYVEAERLGKLAETLSRLGGMPARFGGPAPAPPEPDTPVEPPLTPEDDLALRERILVRFALLEQRLRKGQEVRNCKGELLHPAQKPETHVWYGEADDDPAEDL